MAAFMLFTAVDGFYSDEEWRWEEWVNPDHVTSVSGVQEFVKRTNEPITMLFFGLPKVLHVVGTVEEILNRLTGEG
jgi:hypothetical protein